MNSIDTLTQNTTYGHIVQRYDAQKELTWCVMRQQGRPAFTKDLLLDLLAFQRSLAVSANPNLPDRTEPTRYMVFSSAIQGTFSLGGDLALFAKLIRANDEDALRDYARLSIEILYNNAIAYNLPLTTIALIEGDAIGAGFEAALSCDYVIAERGSRLGFPESLFGLFPGMGAHSFISRKIELAKIEKMILSGRLYSAEEMYELGLVDQIIDSGNGQEEVLKLISKRQRKLSLVKSLREVQLKLNPLSLDELLSIAEIWVKSAMKLTERELKIMDRLLRAQEKKFNSE